VATERMSLIQENIWIKVMGTEYEIVVCEEGVDLVEAA